MNIKSQSLNCFERYIYISLPLYIRTNLRQIQYYYYLIGQIPYSYGPIVATGCKLGGQGVGVQPPHLPLPMTGHQDLHCCILLGDLKDCVIFGANKDLTLKKETYNVLQGRIHLTKFKVNKAPQNINTPHYHFSTIISCNN